MKLYQAPLEGITTYIYRNALARHFGGADKYFAPCISPYEKIVISAKERAQLTPSHNEGIDLVPQILTMDAEGFLKLTHLLHEEYGYEEFNLNFGCPSGTVVSKGRGSGSLKDLELLKDFLDRITDGFQYRLSVKTRVGFSDVGEWAALLELYNRYSLSELIIHPRVGTQMYKGVPDVEAFEYAVANSRNPVVYNGDIRTVEDCKLLCHSMNVDMVDVPAPDSREYDVDEITDCEGVSEGTYCNNGIYRASETSAVMIGRGMIANPAIFREIKGGPSPTGCELMDFMSDIGASYMAEFDSEVNVLHKLKEIWVYMGPYVIERGGGSERDLKELQKTRRLVEYKAHMRSLLSGVK